MPFFSSFNNSFFACSTSNSVGDVFTWNPSEDSSLVAWWDASDSSTISMNSFNIVTQIDDKSGNSHHLMGFNSPKISLLNTLNTVDFDGSFISGDDFAKTLANTNFGIIDGNIIIVGILNIDGVGNESDSIWSIRSDNNISNYISLESGNSTQFVSSFEFGGLGEFDSELSGGNIRSWSGGPYLGNTIHTTICDFSGSDIYGRMNGTQRINISNEYFTEIDMSSSTFLINSNINETSKLDGLFGELMIFNSNDQSLAIKAEGYLAHKWSMTSLLPSGHPHKDSMP